MQDPFLDYAPNDLTVQVTELLVATSDEADTAIDEAVPKVLKLLRDKMKMDIAFVSEFTPSELVIQYVDANENSPVKKGDSTPLEKTWCQRVINGRLPGFIADCRDNKDSAELLKDLPFPIGTFLSTPIILGNGSIYGTLCCFSYAALDPVDPKDFNRLKYTAQMTADMIDKHSRH